MTFGAVHGPYSEVRQFWIEGELLGMGWILVQDLQL